MSLKLIEQEIKRFLASKQPEVLCIVGGWGVGKTYAWRKYLADAVSEGKLATEKYAYVSLFGLNSLDDLRFAVVQNTVTGDHILLDPNLDTFGALFAKGTDLFRKLKPVSDFVLAAANRKAVSDVLKEASFLAIRNQLVCFDDLERAGKGLDPRDTLGLASHLKETRKCKVALLLNEEQMTEKDRLDFNLQLEKVADVSLRFDLTPAEAAAIALPERNDVSSLVGARVIDLGITNIRVIRKTDKLAKRLAEILHGYDAPLIEQAIATLVAGCFAVYQPGAAPPLEDLLAYNGLLNGGALGDSEEGGPNPWADLLEGYPYQLADQMDAVILSGASGGYFDEVKLRDTAKIIQAELRASNERNPLSIAWQKYYHGSLVSEDHEFLDAIYEGAAKTIETVSFTNLNSAVFMLREFEGDHRADDLIARFIAAHEKENLDFFDLERHIFGPTDSIDPALLAAFAVKVQAYVDPRDPLDVLKSLTRSGWNDADLLLMSKQSADDFVRLFEAMDGTLFREPIRTLLSMARQEGDAGAGILAAATEALVRIGRKSPIRKRKVKIFGIKFPEDAAPVDPVPPV